MKALVTGAGGFIGSHLVTALHEKDWEIRGLFLPGEDARRAEEFGVEIFRGDLTKPETLAGVAKKVDVVFHLATRVLDWGSMRLFREIMVTGTEHLLRESMGNTGRFVYFSSIAALGLGRDLVGLDEDAQRVRCGIPYCDTKIEAEDLIRSFSSDHSLPATIIRPANVIGPGSAWVRDVLDAFYRGPLPLIDGGKAPGAFVYVTNLVDGVVAAATSDDAAGRTYHFRDDYDITWGQYTTILGEWIGKRPLGNLPFGLAWAFGALMEKLLTPLKIRPLMTRLAAGVMGRNLDVDNSRARNELGWKSRVDFERAMAEIKKWVEEVYIPQRQ
jgi:nucleoside-diphosphate-sugar epimerase